MASLKPSDYLLVLERIAQLSAQKSRSAINQLLQLPPEIRNIVYEMVFVQPKPIEAQLKVDRIDDDRRQALHADTLPAKRISYFIAIPSLLRTCRSIRSESLIMFFSRNTFLFPAPAGFAKAQIAFPNIIPYLEYLKKIQVKIGHRLNWDCHANHIYQIDITDGSSWPKVSRQDVRLSTPDSPSEDKLCVALEKWDQAIMQELADIVLSIEKAGEAPAALCLERLLFALRYQRISDRDFVGTELAREFRFRFGEQDRLSRKQDHRDRWQMQHMRSMIPRLILR